MKKPKTKPKAYELKDAEDWTDEDEMEFLEDEEKYIDELHQEKAPHCIVCGKQMKFTHSHGQYMEEPYYLRYECCDLILTEDIYLYDEGGDGWTDEYTTKNGRNFYSLRDKTYPKRFRT